MSGDQVYYNHLLRHLKVKINFSLSLFQIFVHLRSKSSCILFANFDLNFCNLARKASVHFWITDPDCLDAIASLGMLRCHHGIEMVSSEDLEVTGDDLTLQKENIALEAVPHVKELLADLLQVVD